MQQAYALSGMRCQGCARKVRETLETFSDKADVDLSTASVVMTNPTATMEELNLQLATLGTYALSPLAASEPPKTDASSAQSPTLSRYYPLLLIAAYLVAVSFAGAQSAGDWMRHFMAGFFLVFSFFKLLNVRAFANSYAMYDLIAGRWRGYGMVYPFIELALGLAYLFAWRMNDILWATLVLTIVGGIGVLRSMTRRQAVRCACLGAILDVPVSTVTLIEDFGMAAMAIAMLVL